MTMKNLSAIFSQLPYQHHAFGIESSQSIYENLEPILPKEDFSYIFHKQYESLKIDDVRMIKSLQSEKTNKASLFILEFIVVNNEAQNALLKIIEEPTSNTYFILVCPNLKKLLPTLQSRLYIINNTQKREAENVNTRLSEELFFNHNLSERFNLIKELTDKKKEPLKKSEVLIFLDNLELFFTQKGTVQNSLILESIFKARNALSSKGSSHKMILEMLAIAMEHE